jgi:enamine deaminase RidA (YjgF/YER057c/UK114 family)
MADDMPPQGGKRVIVNPWTWQDRFAFVHANVISDGRRVAYCAGQTSTDADGNATHKDDMAGQIEQALANVETVLGEAGMAVSDVVRLNYYVTDVDAFLQAGETLKAALADAGCRPASTLLGVTRLASPDFLVEIEATAIG